MSIATFPCANEAKSAINRVFVELELALDLWGSTCTTFTESDTLPATNAAYNALMANNRLPKHVAEIFLV